MHFFFFIYKFEPLMKLVFELSSKLVHGHLPTPWGVLACLSQWPRIGNKSNSVSEYSRRRLWFALSHSPSGFEFLLHDE